MLPGLNCQSKGCKRAPHNDDKSIDNKKQPKEPSVLHLMGCFPWVSPMVAKAEESVNILDTVCLQPKV